MVTSVEFFLRPLKSQDYFCKLENFGWSVSGPTVTLLCPAPRYRNLQKMKRNGSKQKKLRKMKKKTKKIEKQNQRMKKKKRGRQEVPPETALKKNVTRIRAAIEV